MTLLAFIFLFIPVVFWMFIVTDYIHHGITRRQFSFGIIAGAFTTLPLVFHNIPILGEKVNEILFQLSYISQSFLAMGLLREIVIFFLFMFLIFSLVHRFLFSHNKKIHIPRQALGLAGVIILSLIIIGVLHLFSLSIGAMFQVESGDFLFVGLVAIASYYMIVSLLEEGIKYLGSMSVTDDIQDQSYSYMLCLGASVALGFAFFENILYFFTNINSLSAGELLKLSFFRSVFGASLHMLCSMLIVSAFYHLFQHSGFMIRGVLSFIFLVIMGLVSHMMFDLTLALGHIVISFLYLFGLYIFMVHVAHAGEEGHAV